MNVPTMTVGGDEKDVELEKLRAENASLRERCDAYRKEIEGLVNDRDRAYMRGRIDGLEFSIRCNGVSGDEVKG